jgi:hypothetical protein
VIITIAKYTKTKIHAAPETVYASNIIKKMKNIQNSTGKKGSVVIPFAGLSF